MAAVTFAAVTSGAIRNSLKRQFKDILKDVNVVEAPKPALKINLKKTKGQAR